MRSQSVKSEKTDGLRLIYIALVGISGFAIFAWSLFSIDPSTRIDLLIGLILLNTAAQFAAVSTQHRGIAFGVSQAVNIASIALLGIAAASIIGGAASLSLSIIRKVLKEDSWKGSFEQFAFNTGMETIAVFCAAHVFLFTDSLALFDSRFLNFVPWLLAAVTFEEVNQWILSGIIYIQRRITPFKYRLTNIWAFPINITIGFAGGYLLTQAIQALDWQGLFIFALPLVLSAYSLRMYVRETDRQMLVVMDRTAKLSEANTRLEELAEQKNRMLAVLSHDMRTSLSALQTSAEMLQLGSTAIDEVQRDRLYNVIAKSGNNLTSMVENLISIENAGIEDDNLAVEKFDIAECVRNAVASIAVLADEKSITIKLDQAPDPVIMSADSSMLRHVVLNLVSNAIKYTPKGGEISVDVQAQPHCVLIEVADTGLGIPNQELSRVFEPYYRANSNKHTAEGTGLGLAIVKRFVEAHEGSIDVKSRENEGSRFTVRLPYKNVAAPVAA